MQALSRQPSLVVAILAAAASGSAVILHALNWLTLSASLTMLAPALALLLVAVVVRIGRGDEPVLVNRLQAGLLAGALALVGYDLVRLAIAVSGLVPFNPFRPIEVYGLLILVQAEETLLTKLVGWAFHLWNGLAFAVMYTLTFGQGHVGLGVAWGLVLEVAMVATYPALFGLAPGWAFLVVSLTGHIVYGAIIGLVARRAVRW